MTTSFPLNSFSDDRGTLVEVMKFKSFKMPPGGQVYCFSIKKDKVRGNHFHKEKNEWFVCVAGNATLIVKKDGVITKHYMSSENPVLFHMEPYMVHTLTNHEDADAVVISYSSKEFDPEYPDTFMEVIYA
jgi:dTDP-4-dehydrorhamnose 3,5-epimerase-like enzyme